MIFIQHRLNSPLRIGPNVKLPSTFAEVDVHISYKGQVVIKHNPDDRSGEWPVEEYLASMEKKGLTGYLVDIKQNLDVKYLDRIAKAFGSKLIGLFDIPWPSLHDALRKTTLPIYCRVSEYEPFHTSYPGVWLDPLMLWTPSHYVSLFRHIEAQGAPNIIVAAPSLHGHRKEMDLKVMRRLLDEDSKGNLKLIKGVVTKHVDYLAKNLCLI